MKFKQEILDFDKEEAKSIPEKSYNEYTEEEKRVLRERIFSKRRQGSHQGKTEYTPQEIKFIRDEEEDSREGDHPWYK